MGWRCNDNVFDVNYVRVNVQNGARKGVTLFHLVERHFALSKSVNVINVTCALLCIKSVMCEYTTFVCCG